MDRWVAFSRNQWGPSGISALAILFNLLVKKITHETDKGHHTFISNADGVDLMGDINSELQHTEIEGPCGVEGRTSKNI
ncbi:hypothetical protein DPMN_103505 [Dreissena polymorpha]|uniref:Uncharacterized protein n=1 Tax=Dreissena polymorpha TaxID=45954 RepID=A0A9D4HB97_DREPO|nr:hypothetical protein DPMN_103505 [Dreissena polymorpha]